MNYQWSKHQICDEKGEFIKVLEGAIKKRLGQVFYTKGRVRIRKVIFVCKGDMAEMEVHIYVK